MGTFLERLHQVWIYGGLREATATAVTALLVCNPRYYGSAMLGINPGEILAITPVVRHGITLGVLQGIRQVQSNSRHYTRSEEEYSGQVG